MQKSNNSNKNKQAKKQAYKQASKKQMSMKMNLTWSKQPHSSTRSLSHTEYNTVCTNYRMYRNLKLICKGKSKGKGKGKGKITGKG